MKATETVPKAANRPVDGSGSSLSTGGIIGMVVALLAALGVGAFALAGGLPPQIANALPSRLRAVRRAGLHPSCPASRRKSITCSAPVSQSVIRGPATYWLYGWS